MQNNLTNMEEYKHFSHPHNLSFHKILEDETLTCTGCNFPCTGPAVYSCHTCNFFLHDQCFHAPRSLIHPSHSDHPLSLFPHPTYASGWFICNSCNETGSGFCFTCPICDFDLHVHCAYNELKPKSDTTPNEIHLKAHPNHPLHLFPKPPYGGSPCSCDVCGTDCNLEGELYHCIICGYDVHVECVNLPEMARRDDHEHGLSFLHVNPHETFECDVCRCGITQQNCLYICASGCDYGMHVKCVSEEVSRRAPMEDALAFQLKMLELQNKMEMQRMLLSATGRFWRS